MAAVVVGLPEPINLNRFCDLLEEHAEGSVQCTGKDCAMLFGSTGAGKSTLLHLLAGAKFSHEAVEIAVEDNDEFGGDMDMQLVPDMRIPGCEIGNSASSTTMLLNSYEDSHTGLTFVDTPGFGNVGDDDDEDSTVDAANSAAIMRTIRSCKTLRIVFLISVKDQLNTTRGGQIKSLFSVLDKFIKDASTRLSSVYMLFTHCDGCPSASDVIRLLKRIGQSKVLPEHLVPFLRHAINLLETHGEDLLVRPAENDAQQRIEVVRDLLRRCEGLQDTASALRCPLSDEVRMSLELACAKEKEEIVKGLSCNRILADARPYLEHLYLLYDALRLDDIKRSYFGALEQIMTQAETRKLMAIEAMENESFVQAQGFISIFNCNLESLAPHISKLGPREDLDGLKRQCLKAINEHGKGYISKVEQAILTDDFDAVASILNSSEKLLSALHQYLPPPTKDAITCGAIEKVRARTDSNLKRALQLIKDGRFGAELASLFKAIKEASQNETMLRHVRMHLEGEFPAGEEDYVEASSALNASLIALADELKGKLERELASSCFEEEAGDLARILAEIDAADQNLDGHITAQAKESRRACRRAFAEFKESNFKSLQEQVENSIWDNAHELFKCMKAATSMGSEEEQTSVESRLEAVQNLASTALSERVKRLEQALEPDSSNFRYFIQEEAALGKAVQFPAGYVLREATLCHFKAENERLLGRVEERYQRTQDHLSEALHKHQYAEVMIALVTIQAMAEAGVDSVIFSHGGMTFNTRVAELLQHIQAFAKEEVDKCKRMMEVLRDPCRATPPTQAEVTEFKSHVQLLQEFKKQIGGIVGEVPNLNLISAVRPADLFSRTHQKELTLAQCGGEAPATPRSTTVDGWDDVLHQMLQAAEIDLTTSLEQYACACRERCLMSLEEAPKPRAEDVMTFLKILSICKELDPVFAEARPDSSTKPFTDQRKTVSAAVKTKFMEVRDRCSRQVRASQMAEAQSTLEIAKDMLVLRDVFVGDAIKMDEAVEEMRADFDQRSGAFEQSVLKAINDERFGELNTILLGYRGLTGVAQQEEYNNARCSLMERGSEKYTLASQVIASINDDARGRTEFPPSMQQMAAALRWIEGARCLGEGDDPILPTHVTAQWDQAFHQLNAKLQQLNARVVKLDEWKFNTVEEMHRRLGQLLMLRFPADVSKSINEMKHGLSEALEKKMAALSKDVEAALSRADYLTIDLIFQEVKSAKDDDSNFINNTTYNMLIGILENYLNDLVESIKVLYMGFDVKEAHLRQEHLWKLEKAQVAKNHVARAGLDDLSLQKKKTMFTKQWLLDGCVSEMKAKLKGFESVDPVRYQSLVSAFIESFDNDVKSLRTVETKGAVLEVKQIVIDLPRLATMLDGEQGVFKKFWDSIWNSFFESVRKKLRLACGTGREQDISDSIAFLQAARKLLLQQQKEQIESSATASAAASMPPPTTSERPSIVPSRRSDVSKSPAAAGKGTSTESSSHCGTADSASSSSRGGWGSRLLNLVVSAAASDKNEDDLEEEVDFEEMDAVEEKEGADGQAEPQSGKGDSDKRAEASKPRIATQLCVFPLPIDDGQLQTLIEKLDGLLGQIEVDTERIDADWIRFVEGIDFKKEMTAFEDTLRFLRLLKIQSQAIAASGEYGFFKQVPSADRAITRISTAASDCIKDLDASNPEEAITVLRNLNDLCNACPRVIDDDVELQGVLKGHIGSRREEANAWVTRLQNDLAKKGVEYYGKAEKEPKPAERKKLLHEVSKSLELHNRLQEKLVACQLRKDDAAEAPLVTDIKKKIQGMHINIQDRVRIRGNVTADEVAVALHTIYVTAFDLGQTSIVEHAEACISHILQDCKGKAGLSLQEVGAVLERDLPQGGEIVANIPQFAELNLIQFQQMTMGKSVEGTVEEVAKLNNLPEAHAASLLQVVKEIFTMYERIMKMGRFHPDFPSMVSSVKGNFKSDKSIPGLIGGVFAIWSMSTVSEQCRTARVPLAAQVVAIVRLLTLDKPDSYKGFFSNLLGLSRRPESSIDDSHLAQIKTGQGKSVVLGTLATVLCILGFHVDCVCYSAYLSERDYKDFEPVFKHFGVREMVNYGTFQQLSEQLINEEGDVRAMTLDVILGSKEARTSPVSPTKKKRILLVDEVDVFFSCSFYGETFDPVVPLQLGCIAELQKRAWEMRSGDTKLILPALKDMDAYKALMRDFSSVHQILEGQIKKMIRDLEAWKSGGRDELYREYKIIDGKVAYKSGVCYDSKISFGYVTLWTYFHEVECKRIPGSALDTNLGLMINCGQFSYAEIPKRYDLILGVTGTLVPEKQGGLHPLGTFEQEIVTQDYKIKGQTELPSVFGERNLTFREHEHVSVQKTTDEFNNAIGHEVAKAVDGRAVLIFFESEAKMEAWQASPYGQRVSAGTMEVIKSDTKDITMKVRKATHAGQVTLLSREHGRGLDFHCTDKKVDDLGGLHVVQTFLSEELSEEIQIRGRTARQKNKGSFQMILLLKDLEKFMISAADIDYKEKGIFVPVYPLEKECAICHQEHTDPVVLQCGHGFCKGCLDHLRARESAHCKCPLCRKPVAAPSAPASPLAGAAGGASGAAKQTLYEFLHAKRAVWLDQQSLTRRQTVWCAKALHDQSIVFQKDLLSLSRIPAARRKKAEEMSKCIKFLGGRNISTAKCRLMCLSDATGSMQHTWAQTQDSIKTMLERITAISGGSGNIEVKWVAYRDYELERSRVLEASPWTDDPASLVKFVGSIQCQSAVGCDGPEAVEAALYYANSDPEPPTRVLLIGDAPPHHEGKGNRLESLQVHQSNQELGAFVQGGVLSTDYRTECAKLRDAQIKVFSFYLSPNARKTFDEISKVTGGQSQALDPKEAESLIHAVSETALEDIGGASMLQKYRAQYRA